MPSPPDRLLAEGSGVSPSPPAARPGRGLVEAGVVVLVAALSVLYAIAAFRHATTELPVVSPTAATASR